MLVELHLTGGLAQGVAMISAQSFNHLSLLVSVRMRSLQRNVQEWIRQEIVDDDPYEQR